MKSYTHQVTHPCASSIAELALRRWGWLETGHWAMSWKGIFLSLALLPSNGFLENFAMHIIRSQWNKTRNQ